MRAPSFWWNERPSLLAQLLAPAGAVYGFVTARRMERRGETVGVPVICVGNFVAGGAGKTPAAIAIAGRLAAAGERPMFVTRGYGGTAAGPLLVDPQTHTAVEVGDEPLLLARAAPTVVARDRVRGARLAASLGASIVVLDDGLQNPGLTKTLALAVVDGETGVGNGLPLPAGPLRASVGAQLPHVDAVVLIGEGAAGERLAERAAAAGKPVCRGRLRPDAAALAALEGARVLAFAGIGRPQKFFRTLAQSGVLVEERVAFPDHHAFGRGEVADMIKRADARGLVLVTTEKDAVRLAGVSDLAATRGRVKTLPVTLEVDDAAALDRLLTRALAGSGA
ncbi:tetraacyldisaccharide 4'-kinase [Chelatococcus reniformis]|uniref:Tetraacyldisaccharide 4'-kinase n=1 Tax=Chelatococcus reniformis TaxID=1494448 RepID=A0A916UC86_9HYPH|nr:tetraacyldisaccharide 4'-kinase [Chelatococcus reniformis]GGC67554.1 tetraacyldisaccharide 4'-kinase [Chelatococcus reniformis]